MQIISVDEGIDGIHIHNIQRGKIDMMSRISNKYGAPLGNQAQQRLSLYHLEETVDSFQLLINNQEVSDQEDPQVQDSHYQRKKKIVVFVLTF